MMGLSLLSVAVFYYEAHYANPANFCFLRVLRGEGRICSLFNDVVRCGFLLVIETCVLVSSSINLINYFFFI